MRTVLCHGVFDLLHSGHMAHLQQARAFGDKLMVSVLADRFVVKKRFLLNDERERMYCLTRLRDVDYVVLCEAPGPEDLLRKLKPAIYVRNDEYIDQTKPEYAVVRELGIEVGFTRTVPPHTSEIIARILAQHAKGADEARP